MVPFSIHFNEKWRSFPHTDFSFEKLVSCIWISLYPMYKSYLCWFSELLWKESVCISARKFYDKMSILPEGYVCKPKGQVSYLNAKTEAGGLQLQSQAELTRHSLKNMKVRFLSLLGLMSSSGAPGLRMVSACMPGRSQLLFLPLTPVLIPTHKPHCQFQAGQSVPVFSLSPLLSRTCDVHPET